MFFHCRRITALAVAVLVSILAACRPAAAPVSPTAQATATLQPSPTPTATATATPAPTATPTATLTPSPTPTPAPQPITSNTANLLKPVEEQPWHAYHGLLKHIAWSTDGKFIAGQFSDYQPRTIVWDANTLQQIARFTGVTFRQWTPDNHLLLRTGEGQYATVTPQQGAQPEPLDISCFGDNNIVDLRYSPQGRYLAALVNPRVVLVCNQETQELQRYEVPWDKRAIHELYFGMFSPYEDWLFLWGGAELPPYAFTIAFNLHQKRIYATYPGLLLALSPQGNRVLVNDESAMKVKVAFTGADLSAFSYGVSHYDAQTQTSDGWMAIAADFASQTQVGVMLAHYNQPFDAQFLVREIGSREISKTLHLREVAGGTLLSLSPDRARFAIASHDGYLRVYDTEGKMLGEKQVADNADDYINEPPGVSLSPNGNSLAKPEGFTALGIYTLPNEQPDFTLPRTMEDGLFAMPMMFDFVSDNLVKTWAPNGMDLWDLNAQKVVHTYFYDCKPDAKADKLLCWSYKFVALVDGNTQEITTQMDSGKHLRGYAMQPQGNFVALCNDNADPITLWQTDPVEHRPNLLLKREGKPTPACGALVFSADGRYLISGAGGVWEIESGEQVGEFPPLRGYTPPTDDDLNPPPPMELSTGPADLFWVYDPADHTLTLHRLPDGETVHTITLPKDTVTFRFASDGMRLVVVQLDRITTWKAVP